MRLLAGLLLVAGLSARATAHDIPNARVDRAIQATVRPGRLAIDYEVSLAELTLTQDLRALIGTLPGADRAEWFDRYGRETGPLNARGLLVWVDGEPRELACEGFDLAVEEHPRYTFHLTAPLPPRGRLRIRDTNYAAGEGMSRLAVRGVGVVVGGDDAPEDVALIKPRPVWQLSDEEERRTREVEIDFEPSEGPPAVAAPTSSSTRPPASSVELRTPNSELRTPSRGLSRLLDSAAGMPLAGACLLALALGAAHAIQPGHGKTLVAAASLGGRGGWARGAALAGVILVAHMSGVLAVAAALWATRSTRYAEIDRTLARMAGVAIAAIGLWRLGRHLAGHAEHDEAVGAPDLGVRGLVGLGVAGGLVPCWDAVVLIVLAEAIGRLALGLILLAAFSLGMGAVLVGVGLLAGRVGGLVARGDRGATWEHRLGMLSGAALAAIGLVLWNPLR